MLLAAAPDSQEKALQIAAHHAFIKQAQNLSLLSDEDYMVNSKPGPLNFPSIKTNTFFPKIISNISSHAKEKSSW